MKSLKSCVPNTITCLNLLSGAVACICAFHGMEKMGALTGFEWAMIAIGAAAVFDFLDGAMARLLHAYSDMGKELDSLSDLVSFGLAPALMMFTYINSLGYGMGWAFFALWIVVMGALRLAKFNVDDRQTTSFIGLPIPANALFWIGILWFFMHVWNPGLVVTLVLVVLFPLLMVSNIPLFSLKFSHMGLDGNIRRYILIVATIILLFVCGVSGLAWTVLFYILLALTSPRGEKA